MVHAARTLNFNPRPREKGDLAVGIGVFVFVIFQSTPSWKGRRFAVGITGFICKISIHALVKRATGNKNDISKPRLISIHALVKRATCFCHNNLLCSMWFQSTPSWKGRQYVKDNGAESLYISIHALVKRATVKPPVTKTISSDFNPRPREKGDQFNIFFHIFCHRFQSTPSWKGRLGDFHC